jgi:hypothetical protein
VSDVLHRTAELAVRADGGERVIFGVVVPYGQTATVNDGRPSTPRHLSRKMCGLGILLRIEREGVAPDDRPRAGDPSLTNRP